MHGAWKRQLFLACVLLCSGLAALADTEEVNAELRAIDALQEKLMERPFNDPEIQQIAGRYQKLVEKHADVAGVHAAHAQFLAFHGQFRGAKKEWETAQRLAPSNAVYVQQFAECLLSLGEVPSAIAALEKTVQLAPDCALYHHNLGNAYFLFRHKIASERLKKSSLVLAEGLAHLRKASELAPANFEFARGYAETFYGMPDPDWREALKAWEHVLEISDDKELVYSHLVRVRLGLHQIKEARQTLEKLPEGSKLRSVLERQIDAVDRAAAPKK